jgi:hypothetical protein
MTTQNETTTTLNTFEQNEAILGQLIEETIASGRQRKVKTERSIDDEASSCND